MDRNRWDMGVNKDRIRIKDIAQRAGVSTGTVDRVLHGRPGVSQQARAAVQRALDELNYRPNIIARTLAHNREYRIGIVVPDSRNEPYWEYQTRGIQNALETMNHYGIALVHEPYKLHSPKSFLKKGLKLLKHGVDAAIVAPLFREQGIVLLNAFEEAGIPCVLVNTDLPHPHKMSYIGQDSYQSGVVAAKLLDQLMNPKDIALVVHMETDIQDAEHLLQKQRGFQKYFTEYPRKVVVADLAHCHTARTLNSALTSIFHEHSRIGGIFVTSSRIHQVMAALPPVDRYDLRAVGFDLIEPNLHYLESGRVNFLINQNPQLQGYIALRQIVHHLVVGKEMPNRVYIPFDIVVKENMKYYMTSHIPLSGGRTMSI